MKFRDLLLTANGNLAKSKLRTALTIIAVFIGALTLMLTTGVGAGLKSYVNEQVNAVGAKDVMIIQGVAQQVGFGSDDGPKEYNPDQAQTTSTGFQQVAILQNSDLQKIQKTPGIISAQPMYTANPDYITSTSTNQKFQTVLTESIEGVQQPQAAGTMLDMRSSQAQITIPQSFVGPLGFGDDQNAVGKTVTFGFTDAAGQPFTKDATIVGVQEKILINEGGISGNTALLQAAQEQTAAPLPPAQQDQFVMVVAKINPDMSQQDKDALKNALKDQGYEGTTLEDQLGVINDVINAITTFLNIFAAIALIAATFGIVNTLFMAVQERTREIGLMKALGMSRGKIFTLFSLEAILIGFWGAIIALGAANIIGRIGSTIAANTIFKSFDGLQLFSFPFMSMLPIILVIMLIAFLAATLPARRAARLDPIEALRYE